MEFQRSTTAAGIPLVLVVVLVLDSWRTRRRRRTSTKECGSRCVAADVRRRSVDRVA
jgi:hypothetical protein